MTEEEKQAIETLRTIKRPTLATGFDRQTKILQALENIIKGYREERDLRIHYENRLDNMERLYVDKDKIKEKIEEQYELWNTPNKQKEYSQEVVDVLEELLEDK